MVAALSLDGWGSIAQLVIAVSGLVALVGAGAQLRLSRANALRSRVYEYADRFNTQEMLQRSTRYKAYWEKHSYTDFKSLDDAQQLDWLMLPNLIEEIAFLYNRKLLDRDVAAELLGVYVERLWEASQPLIGDIRQAEGRPTIFREWGQMQEDTPGRRRRAIRRDERRRALPNLFLED
jgi:hypothetical protein